MRAQVAVIVPTWACRSAHTMSPPQPSPATEPEKAAVPSSRQKSPPLEKPRDRYSLPRRYRVPKPATPAASGSRR